MSPASREARTRAILFLPRARRSRRAGPGSTTDTRWSTSLALVASLALAAACGPGGGLLDGAADANDAARADAADLDATRDAAARLDVPRETDHDASAARDVPLADAPDGDGGCEPSCHVDCFGSAQCRGGDVWTHAYAPWPCCRRSDIPSDGSLVCRVGAPYACPSRRCADALGRYGECLARLNSPPYPVSEYRHVLRVACADSEHRAGDACASDDDCAPAAEAVPGGFRCDTAAGRCVERPRPAEPARYGASCGLTTAPAGGLEGLVRTGAADCALCHVTTDASTGCVRQACTTACRFDEDCPAGSVCLCAGASGFAALQFCARVTDRASSAGRTAWLRCP